MGSIFGKLGYSGNIGPYKGQGPGEMPFDQIDDNIANHYNEQIKFTLRADVTGKAKIDPNGGLCTHVKQSG